MIDHKLSEEEALRLFPHGYEGVNVSQRNYLKLTAQPNLHVKKPPSSKSYTVEACNEDEEDEYDHINADYHKYEF